MTPHKEYFVEHLQMMKVAGYRVLFSAESDAVNSEDNPVEIKASNPIWWGTKPMFQMISNGSSSLYFGFKEYSTLHNVRVDSLATTAATALANSDVRVLENSIRNGMETLQREAKAGRFDDDGIFTITFHGNSLELTPFSGRHIPILPSPKVVSEILSDP